MAKMNGSILLTERQIKLLSKGKFVYLVREKQKVIIGVKASVDAKFAIRAKIKKLREQLHKL